MSLQKIPIVRSKAIRDAAKGEPCTICGRNDGTTVFCHLNESFAGKGVGRKASDIAGFMGCRNCHDEYDGRKKGMNINPMTDWMVMRAMYRTWVRLIELGIITIKGAK